MGAFLDKPKTDKYQENGSGNGLRYGVASMQGWRVEMEDAHRAKTGLDGALKDWSYFAVFDGHAGARVSAHCSEHLLESIMQTEEFQEDVTKGIHCGFLQLDSRMRELPEMSSGEDKSGSTAVCAFISPRQIYIANCGDSRAVLCRDGMPVFSTRDHKPALPAERERIQKAGGSVMIQRVNGSLAVSRALGDYEYKNVEGRGQCEQLVSPEPEIFSRDRDDDADEFLVLACDGIWDVMSNEDLCQYIHSRLKITDDLELITSQVVDTCLYKGSRDNMSIVLVTLPGAPRPCPDALKAEQDLEATIERRIKEFVDQSDQVDFPCVLQKLIELDIQGLPPGGGLAAKRTFIEQVFKDLCPGQAESFEWDASVMATSSSDESSTAPKDFHLSSSVDSGSRLSPYHHKCQLCNNFRKKFYCKECIQNGDFVSSSSLYSERFADKQLRLLKLKSLRRAVEDRCCEYLSKKQKIDDANNKIRTYTERVRLLKLLLQEAKDKQDTNKSRLKFLINEVKASNIRLPKYDDRVEKLERYVAQKAEKVEESRTLLAEEREKLKKLARARVHQLIEYIFPISQLQPSRSEVELSGEQDTVSALAEATRTAYVKGRWVFTDSSGELHHSIVAPTLPGSGDYSAYNLWVAENKDAVPNTSNTSVVDHNPAFNITAALTYTTQLVNILAFYLDVRLPYKMIYSDFCGSDMNELQFARRVARLNANVLQLCFSQSVRPEVLYPPRTLHNILQLLNTDNGDLGRLGPIEIEPELASSLEDQLSKDLETSEDSDSEEGDTLPYEWEAVPHVQCPEVAAGSATLQSQQMTATQTTSMAGGLVTSAAASLASIWRGWTGK